MSLLAALATLSPALAEEPTTTLPALPTEWRMEMVVATRALIPVLGATRAEVRSTLAVRLVATADGWVQTQDTCDARLVDRGKLVRTTLPPAFVRALPDATFAVTVAESEGSQRYEADFGRQDVGWDGRGEMPAEADAPGVVDWDGDGLPGATVLVDAPIVGTGQVYVAQTGRTRVRGERLPDGTIQGTIEVTDFAQHVLGGSSPLFRHGPEVVSDPERSWFRMTPAPGFSCGALGAVAEADGPT